MYPGEGRAGRYVQQLEGYRAFEPASLPPEPPLHLGDLQGLLSEADLALGRLDGAARYLPDVELFIGMYVRCEALLSSQIEGTECTLDDLLDSTGVPQLDVTEVVNYVAALNRGLAMLGELPLCNRALRDVHGVLLRTGRGADKAPGELRRTQNWIGPPGAALTSATFVPHLKGLNTRTVMPTKDDIGGSDGAVSSAGARAEGRRNPIAGLTWW
jgi:Fic family protein